MALQSFRDNFLAIGDSIEKMTSVDDVWAEMLHDRTAASSSKQLSVEEMLRQAEQLKRKKTKKSAQLKKENVGNEVKVTFSASSSASAMPKPENMVLSDPAERPMIEARDMLLKIARNVDNLSNSDDVSNRKNALQKLYSSLFEAFTMSERDYSEVFREIAKPVFKRFADPVEKCRELSLKITQCFFENSSDLVLVLGYFIPALMQRSPGGMAYDEDMKVFVMDQETHEAYRRGKAVDRQDKGDALQTVSVIETSEELRLMGCTVLVSLITKLCANAAASVLHPYFYEIIMFLQAQLRDPFADVKLVACAALEFMTTVDEFNTGLKFFAVGLVRAILPVLRHKHAKVRAAGLCALKTCIAVPDRAKLKGSGTEAIPDLVGFREENVLNVASFYKADVQINHLAELVQDKSILVREKIVEMLTVLLTEIGDRYDHQTRLVPYLLDLLTDEADTVAGAAMKCLQICGKQYEEEHNDEIIERRQYGVDGDHRINLDKPLPRPFTERPRIGMRLYVRGNTKRFLTALVNELTNWVSQTRLKSANLLKAIVVLCEEHITMEAHSLLPAFIKALGFAKDDSDQELHSLLLEVYELVGRYVLPETYIHYILPRLTGDPAVTQFGVDTATRISVMDFLGALLSGSKSSELIPHFEALSAALTDSFVINPDSPALIKAAMGVMIKLLAAMRGKGNAAIQAHFLMTGRLTNLKGTIAKVFNWFLGYLVDPSACDQVLEGLLALSVLESDSCTESRETSVRQLFDKYAHRTLVSVSNSYELLFPAPAAGNYEYNVLSALAECPFYSLQSNTESVALFVQFACSNAEKVLADNSIENGDLLLVSLNSLMMALLAPATYDEYGLRNNAKACARMKEFLNAPENSSIGDNGLCFGKPKVCSTVTSGLSSPRKEAARRAVAGYQSRILEIFVFNSKWSQSQLLQTSRLELLSALIGHSPSLSSCSASNDDSAGQHILEGENLIAAFAMIADRVVNHALNPCYPLKLRLTGVEIVGELFLGLIKSWFPGDDLATLVKPFSYWEKASTSGERMQQAKKRIVAQEQAQVGIALILRALDDSSDDVRFATLVALCRGVGLVGCANFTPVVARVLREVISVSNTDAFVELLDQALRSLGVLSPAEMKALVQSLMEDAPSSARSGSGYLSLADLMDHTELLLQLRI